MTLAKTMTTADKVDDNDDVVDDDNDGDKRWSAIFYLAAKLKCLSRCSLETSLPSLSHHVATAQPNVILHVKQLCALILHSSSTATRHVADAKESAQKKTKLLSRTMPHKYVSFEGLLN